MNYIWGDSYKLECGCEFELTGTGYIMHWCPKHKAAPDMYEALKALVEYHERNSLAIPCLADSLQALAKAEGK